MCPKLILARIYFAGCVAIATVTDVVDIASSLAQPTGEKGGNTEYEAIGGLFQRRRRSARVMIWRRGVTRQRDARCPHVTKTAQMDRMH
jgi:hypothetical protein